MAPAFRRKRNRLSPEVYQEARAFSVTLRCAEGVAAFRDVSFARWCIEALRVAAEKHRFDVVAFCFMPNHVHLLVQSNGTSDVPSFLREFKQHTGYQYRQHVNGTLWQKSYYDHVLRREEDIRDVARYILGNPVRAALVGSPEQYPLGGSFVWGKAIVEA